MAKEGKPAKRIAVIGLGPAGAITIDALAKEQAFDIIRVFERREAPGGCWLGEGKPPPLIKSDELKLLSSRTADPQLPTIPSNLPAQLPKSRSTRYSESTVYPYLETNVDFVPMQYTQEPFPTEQSEHSRSLHGEDTPFRHWSLVQDYVRSLVDRRGYGDFISYNTTVERAEKMPAASGFGEEWKLTLRKDGENTDYWWEERFDAVIVASGHYNVPYIPSIDGLPEFARDRPGSVIHSKHFRGRDAFKGKKIVVVGASVSAGDIAFDLTQVAQAPVYAVVKGHTFNGYFGDEAFNHPLVKRVASISHIEPTTRTVHFVDGSSASGVDHIIFGTGYSWTLPFFTPQSSDSTTRAKRTPVPTPRNNRIPNLYLHTIYTPDPTILFVGAVNAGLTFKIFEYQAVLAARLLAGRVPSSRLPSPEAQLAWEVDRIAKRGDGPKFALVFPDFEEYFEELRRIAGPPTADGKGRELPPFNTFWFERFMQGHERRKDMWKRLNAQARETLGTRASEGSLRPKL
ncbi:dimethylaniline monooxygenase [Colletotrichum nymphaeae SA-01]|uniref:Dimethylaniline monooxygenase n=1 Tax=Colletotrichum nymphaeae SA-01 TaxID=1460502 RepID=A0A135TZ55_9PEZI|nr:dimethylaniline monooxygenase [Colletotrichum nymphaeae SA-01]